MPITPVDLDKILRVFSAQVLQGIKYRLGGKAPSLSAAPAQLESGIDCSGLVRLLMFQAGGVVMPDGSWNQRDWCEKNLQEVPYSQAVTAKPGELYIAFITPNQNGAGSIGHVWFCTQRDGDAIAETLESYGGHGIGSRPANTAVLVRLVSKCFKVPTATAVKAKLPLIHIPPLLILDGIPYPVLFDGDGRPYPQLAAKLAAERREIVATTNRLDQNPPRFYVHSRPKG